MTGSLTFAHSSSLTENTFSHEADLRDWQCKCKPEALLTFIVSLSFWNLTWSWWFRSHGMWYCIVGWAVPIISEDRGAFIFKGKQLTFIFQIIGNRSPNDMTSHCRMLESSATPLWEPQISHEMVLLQDVPEVVSFRFWFIWWSYPTIPWWLVGSGDAQSVHS